MDAREQLRRFLEQRRELGESELLLDTLSVDEALKILGAAPVATGTAPDPAPTGVERPKVVAESGDWRATLRAAGAAPPSAEPKPSRAREPEPSHIVPTRTSPPPVGLTVGALAAELFGGPSGKLDSLTAVAEEIAGCRKCPLYSTARNPVPGEGAPNAQLVFVGEAPGQTEDETGRPFVGAAGQLLTKIIAAIDLKREDVFICNVLKHRPPNNRNPLPDEVTACSPYLVRQIELIRPKVLVALGTFAAQTLLNTKLSIGKLRGQIHRYYGVPLIVTYHPAALLRNPSWKRPTWEDVQLARRILDSASSSA